MNFQTMSKQRKFILTASAIGLISMFLPWIDVFFMSVNGMHGKGILIFLCFVACGVISLMGNQTLNLVQTFWMVTLIASGLATLLMVITFLQATGSSFSFFSYGFYLAFLSAIGIILAAYLLRTAGESIKSGFESLKNDIESKTKSNTPQ